MPFIRTQKLVYDKAGRIVSGSASIIDVTYNPEERNTNQSRPFGRGSEELLRCTENEKDFFNLQPEVLWFTMLMPMLSHLHR